MPILVVRNVGRPMTKRVQHVIPSAGGWSIRQAGSAKASSVHKTQQEAVARAREMAQKEGSELFIHGRDGRIRERNSYNRDRHPPKG